MKVKANLRSDLNPDGLLTQKESQYLDCLKIKHREFENLFQDSSSASRDKARLEAAQERSKEGMPRNDITFITCCKGPTRVSRRRSYQSEPYWRHD